jgi:hypothetical protein
VLTAPMVGESTTTNCEGGSRNQLQEQVYHGKYLTEMSAHSPRYSTNNGRVASKKAGEASIAVATPALKAYLRSGFFNVPHAQEVCFSRPKENKEDRAGVWVVSGACGRTVARLAAFRS